MVDILTFSTGEYRGEVVAGYNGALLLSVVDNIEQFVTSPSAIVLASGRNRTVLVEVPFGKDKRRLVIKRFPGRGRLWDIYGTKARRTWKVAIAMLERGVGTPPPVLYMERYRRGKVLESFYVAEYVSDTVTVGHKLVQFFQEKADYKNFVQLLQTVAEAVKTMHDAGIYHRDMGNQNILVSTKDESLPQKVLFTDLNRGRIKKRISIFARGRDISRLNLPEHFVHVFLQMYWGDIPPFGLRFFQSFHRKLYAVHCATRWLRHPIRCLTSPRHSGYAPIYPEWHDMWVWDAEKDVPVKLHSRSQMFTTLDYIEIIKTTLQTSSAIFREQRNVVEQIYHIPVEISGRIGISLSPVLTFRLEELVHAPDYNGLPVMLRLNSHYSDTRNELAIKLTREIHRNHPVALIFIQDRFAVRDIQKWHAFVFDALSHVAEFVEFVEIGCGTNRGEWGIWKKDEYLRMLDVLASIRSLYPHLKVAGPSIINFDYGFIRRIAGSMHGNFYFDMLSNHLQIDNEIINNENKLIRDFVRMKAIACSFFRSKLFVSEIMDNMASSVSYHTDLAERRTDGSPLTDELCSAFIIRYILTGLCSGSVERIYCRLPAVFYDGSFYLTRGRDKMLIRALSCVLSILGKAKFIERLPSASHVYLLLFQKEQGEKICAVYTTWGECKVTVPFKVKTAVNFIGDSCHNCISGNQIMISMNPVYIFLDE